MTPRPGFTKSMPKWDFTGKVLIIRKMETEWVDAEVAEAVVKSLAPQGMLFPDGEYRPIPIQQVKWKNGLDGETCVALVAMAPDVHEVFAAWLNNPAYNEAAVKKVEAEVRRVKDLNDSLSTRTSELRSDFMRVWTHYSFYTEQPWWIRLKWVFTGIPKMKAPDQ